VEKDNTRFKLHILHIQNLVKTSKFSLPVNQSISQSIWRGRCSWLTEPHAAALMGFADRQTKPPGILTRGFLRHFIISGLFCSITKTSRYSALQKRTPHPIFTAFWISKLLLTEHSVEALPRTKSLYLLFSNFDDLSKFTILCDVTLYNVVDRFQCFGKSWCFHLQGSWTTFMFSKVAPSSAF
jgi:hypothetical protein